MLTLEERKQVIPVGFPAATVGFAGFLQQLLQQLFDLFFMIKLSFTNFVEQIKTV